jgi:solute carrier family 25 protein 16
MAFHTRTQSKQLTTVPPSFIHAYKHIYNEYTSPVQSSQHTRPLLERFPILKFYRGFTVTVAGMVPYAGVSFLSWGYLRSRILPPPKVGHNPPTPIADLVIGAVSGAIAQTASYPFEVVRRRMQVGGITSPDRWLRVGETVSDVWKTRGWRGFYVGLGIGYLKVVPMTAVSFAVWQSCKRLLNV